MERNTLLGLVITILVIGGIIWYAGSRPAGTPAVTEEQSGLPAVSPYVEHANYYDIALNYPTSTPLKGDANTTALSQMRSFLSNLADTFKSEGNFENLSQEDIHMRGFDQGRKESLSVMYLIGSSQNTLSYIYTINEDTGGAHGNTYFKTFVFDTNTGGALALGDVFQPGTDYLGTLSQMARAKLPSVIGQYADFTFIKDGTTPDEKNFQNFFFDGTDFVILFAPYQVAAYAQGPVTLRIPKQQLGSILKQEYR